MHGALRGGGSTPYLQLQGPALNGLQYCRARALPMESIDGDLRHSRAPDQIKPQNRLRGYTQR